MSLILTFLGKGGVGKTTTAIAVARAFAAQNKQVLYVGQQAGDSLSMRLGVALNSEPQLVAPNFSAVQLQATVLLERYWDKMKGLETQYLRTPFFKEVYGQELGILPGMDAALGLSFLRERDAEGKYDVIIYDGIGDLEALRMLGMPEILGWYLRRFKQVLTGSAIGQAISPFVEPILRSILQVSSTDDISQQAGEMSSVLTRGQKAVNDPNRVAAYLVTTGDPFAIATAKYLWGSAQQIGLTVGGIFARDPISEEDFSPLSIFSVPDQPLELKIPDHLAANLAPKPIEIDVVNKQVKLFLPTFNKKQVKLIQLGPEVTIEAGDQRRNIFLPNELAGKQATGAKFQDYYLIISFG
ncbi:Get3/ArsA fold putative tail anchor-mediating ATPase NosAFP [Pseudanabaena mucicola]|uniref:ArsA family ATPase n=1 Tax=Pseudanabaena mucicola FACHB-723 TaxID=2692860 RepID=A0ABR7ZTV7_9CYAN|nr:ArsA family ATPase [Pseudanabaena mucicola]MBD2187202.1 ArsA family ATPase [Pseudanabaena mucicola FACHB-723]